MRNPNYQRQWRKKRREIQDEIMPEIPVKTLRLVIPAGFFETEIQDEIRLVRRCGCGSWVTGVRGEIQDEMASKSPSP
jgi:hypothetical protein